MTLLRVLIRVKTLESRGFFVRSCCYSSFAVNKSLTKSCQLLKRFDTMAYRKLSSYSTIQWDPTHLATKESKHAIILLNHGLDNKSDEDKKAFLNLWSSAIFRVSVDGGTNSLDQLIAKHNTKDVNEDKWIKNPDVICGDFDSINAPLIDQYRRRGVNIINTPDQDETDFTKSVTIVTDQREIDYQNFDYIIAVSSGNGRLDQYLSNLHTLHKFVDIIPIFLVDIGKCISFVLSNLSKHVIQIPTLTKKNSWCSLVPLMEASKLTTTGLKWNLSEDQIKFGSFISTSNQFETDSKEAVIVTSKPVLFSMKYIDG